MGVVLFDLDDTLVSRAYALEVWSTAAASLGNSRHDAVEIVKRVDRGGSEDREDFLAALHSLFEIEMSLAEFKDWYRSDYPRSFRVTADTLTALSDLRRAGWLLGVISNGDYDRSWRKVRSTGLVDYIDTFQFARAGVEPKPAPDLFWLAAEALDTDLDGWMVGDSYAEDVLGGEAVGMNTIWLTLDAGPREVAVEPTGRARSIAEAAALILG